MIGRSIENYKILEKLSRTEEIGVYKAVDLLLNRNVIIKVLDREVLKRADIAEGFRYEAAILAKLDHKCIPSLYSLTTFDSELFMISEFSEGETLDRVLARDGKLSFEKVVSLFKQVFDCIEYTHKNSVAHGWLKTSNIMLTDDGSVKISGYGETEKTSNQSPKNLSAKDNDIYALASMLYESLTGRGALSAEGQFDQNIPQAIESVIRKGLFLGSGDRYQSVAEFRNALITAGFTNSVNKTEFAARKKNNNLPKLTAKSAKTNSERKFIIVSPINISEDQASVLTKGINSKPFQLNDFNSDKYSSLSQKKSGQKRYMVAAAAIFAVLVLHSVWQFSYIQTENLRTAEESMQIADESVQTIQPVQPVQLDQLVIETESNEPSVEQETEKQIVETKSAYEAKPVYKAKEPEIIDSEKTIQKAAYRQNEPKSAPPIVKKKAAPESKAERLRRAEKLLTGM